MMKEMKIAIGTGIAMASSFGLGAITVNIVNKKAEKKFEEAAEEKLKELKEKEKELKEKEKELKTKEEELNKKKGFWNK